MAGRTTTIQRQEFAAAWEAGEPIIAIASRYTITRDQIDRLRAIWLLRPRRRGVGPKPRGDDATTQADEEASGASCDCAPEVARRVAELKKLGLIRGKNVAPSGGRDVVFSVRVFGGIGEPGE